MRCREVGPRGHGDHHVETHSSDEQSLEEVDTGEGMTHTHTHVPAHTHTCTHTHTHTHAHTHTHTHSHTHTHTHTHMHAHTHARTHARTHAHTHTHTHKKGEFRNIVLYCNAQLTGLISYFRDAHCIETYTYNVDFEAEGCLYEKRQSTMLNHIKK